MNASVLKSLIEINLKTMAKNGTPGDGHRNGAVKGRSQTYNPKTEQYVKRDASTGRFMDASIYARFK